MIALDIKQQNSTEVSPLSLSLKDEKPVLSFASLLNAAEVPKTDEKAVPKGLLLALENEQESPSSEDKKGVKSDIVSLLKTQKSEELKEVDDFVELNPKLTASMSVNELKTLIVKAKSYIKSQITQSEGFKKQEIASLPKTLKGLAQVAKKIGIDISKITLEKVQEMPQVKLPKKMASIFTDRQEVKVKSEANNKQSSKKVDTAFDTVEELESKLPQEKPKSKTELSTKPEQEPKVLKMAVLQKVNNDLPEKVKLTAVTEGKEVSAFVKKRAEKNRPLQEEHSKTIKLPKETPLFKAQTKSEITTQELVEVKSMQHEPIQKKKKTGQTLELLLRGEKASHKVNVQTNLTADFSVATAKVIASGVGEKVTKNLETLLRGSESDKSEVQHKTEMAPTLKAESFEVKLHEAKQMVKYLSHDVKNAIDEYKSPFTRLKVQLNPQKLGEIDLTIVQRGKNLHINLSSNNAAINTLAMNANDLKVQLSNNGINNASLNFNNNSQSGDGSFGSQTQQQHQQQREHAQSEYRYTQTQESGEEILSSLEIVVPHYA